MYANRRNFRVLMEIGIEEHDGGVRFFTGSGNTADSPMRNASALIIGTVRSLWTWLWGRYHVPQNSFLVVSYYYYYLCAAFVFLTVCLLATLHKSCWSDLYANFTRDVSLDQEVPSKFWKSSRSGSGFQMSTRAALVEVSALRVLSSSLLFDLWPWDPWPWDLKLMTAHRVCAVL